MYPFKMVTIHLRPTMGSPFGFWVCNPEALVGVDSTDRKSCDAGERRGVRQYEGRRQYQYVTHHSFWPQTTRP